MTQEEINAREQRGLQIAALCRIDKKGSVYLVPSQSGTGKYTVVPDAENPHCSCPDHETRGCRCKHIYAVEFLMKREQNQDGSVTETVSLTLTEKRTTYPQNWAAYNRAQTNEKAIFQALLHELCQGIDEPEQTMGRPRMPLRDAIFAACFKVYSTVSGRRFMTDMRESHEEGFVGKCPSYNMIFKVFESEETFDILKALVVATAAPLQAMEEKFACDSSGFSGSRFDRWFDYRYGKPIKTQKRVWVKAHVMVGVKTNVITAVEIHDQDASDGVQLPALLETTAEQFTVKEVSADMAYSWKSNVAKVDSIGATPLIPFKKNANPPTNSGVWARLYHYFQFNRDDFLNRYHLRSNVESVFSAVKRKFGDSVRSKLDVAMKNEVLAKFVCHNICVLIQEMHESGIDPSFCQSSPAKRLRCVASE